MKTILITIGSIFVYYLIAYFFCSINPNESYSWYYGIWHGLFWFPNLIMSAFSETIYAKASNVGIGYNIAYYATAIISSLIGGLLKIIVEAYLAKGKD